MTSSSSAATTVQLRKRIEDLTPSELTRFRQAFDSLLKIEGMSGYYGLAGIYGLPLPLRAQLGNQLFLPWNRAYLYHFERALQDHAPHVTLPWWDWTSHVTDGSGIPAPFAVDEIDGRPNPLYSVAIPEAAREGIDKSDEITVRDPGPPDDLPAKVEILNTLQFRSFNDFQTRLEQLHNMMHTWVGGTLSRVMWSAYDPLFWPLQATIDQIWRTWQLTHPSESLPSSLLSTELQPFNLTVSDVLDVTRLGYDYQTPLDVARIVGPPGAMNDLPAAQDSLGFETYAAAFADLFTSPWTNPPLTIGIYGSWGMGKSSLLRHIKEELRRREDLQPNTTASKFSLLRKIQELVRPRTRIELPEKPKDRAIRVHVVDFNAWDYSANNAIWPALIRKTMDSLEANAPLHWFEKMRYRLHRNVGQQWRRYRSRLLTAALILVPLIILTVSKLHFTPAQIWTSLIALGLTGILNLLVRTFNSPLSKWLADLFEGPDYGQQLDLMSEIHQDLEFLHDRLQDEARMLITIDDLDRCEPQKAVEVLQAVNLLLNFPSFIVCLGIDARVVTAAVEAYYQGLLGSAGASGFEYLDKIIQIPFRIPKPSPYDLRRFLQGQLPVEARAATHSVSGAPSENPSASIPSEQSSSGNYDVPIAELERRGDSDEKDMDTAFSEEEVRAFQKLAAFVEPNPRHLKRLINVYRLVRTLAERSGDQTLLEHRHATVRWLVISAQWPYTAHAMTAEFEQLSDSDRERFEDTSTDLLPHLLSKALPRLDRAEQAKLDGEMERLRALLEDNQTRMTATEFETIRRYAINFNPAVEVRSRGGAPTAETESANKGRLARGHSRPSQSSQLLELVRRFPGIEVTEAAKLMDIAPGSASRLVARLQRNGTLSREGEALHLSHGGDNRGAAR